MQSEHCAAYGVSLFVYFINVTGGYAVKNAETLKVNLGR